MSRRDMLEPEFTPADRLEALHHVAIAAREVMSDGSCSRYVLRIRLTELEKIERYLGITRAESAA